MNGAAAAATAAVAQATRASGVIVRMEPDAFEKLLRRQEQPLIVRAVGGIFGTNYQYLTSYKGLAFFTKSAHELDLPAGSEVIMADQIWIPG